MLNKCFFCLQRNCRNANRASAEYNQDLNELSLKGQSFDSKEIVQNIQTLPNFIESQKILEESCMEAKKILEAFLEWSMNKKKVIFYLFKVNNNLFRIIYI